MIPGLFEQLATAHKTLPGAERDANAPSIAPGASKEEVRRHRALVYFETRVKPAIDPHWPVGEQRPTTAFAKMMRIGTSAAMGALDRLQFAGVVIRRDKTRGESGYKVVHWERLK